MPYPDPANPLPNPPPGRNPPVYRETDSGVGMGAIVGGLVAVLLFLGGLFYMMAPSTNTASNPPASTVGQGGTTMAPPAATPPTPPAATPAPAAPAPVTPPSLQPERN